MEEKELKERMEMTQKDLEAEQTRLDDYMMGAKTMKKNIAHLKKDIKWIKRQMSEFKKTGE